MEGVTRRESMMFNQESYTGQLNHFTVFMTMIPDENQRVSNPDHVLQKS